jgi:chorismate mutase
MRKELKIEPFRLNGQERVRKPLMIAGPCSAESREQVLKTAHALKRLGVHVFRAGIWKPRTRPGDFQGIGTIGLPWLRAVKEETGMYVTTEVANRKHVEEALKYGVDILWIGARTTANPFAVDEVASALEGLDVPVMVKNPIQPELSTWIGAIERLNRKGIKRIAAIHRGFSMYSRNHYRYPPLWGIPKKLKKEIPGISVINDPSHISGDRNLIPEIMKQAMKKHFDGFMVEVHADPDTSLSDGSQQLLPESFEKLMKKFGLSEY